MIQKTGILLLLTAVTFITTACRQDNAAMFNDKLVELKEKADSDFVSMNKYLNIALQENEFSTINYITQSAADSLTERINGLNKLATSSSGETFKDATAQYIQTLINASRAYKSYEILSDSAFLPQQIDSLRKSMKKGETEIEEALKILIDRQQEFARMNNLKLEPNKN